MRHTLKRENPPATTDTSDASTLASGRVPSDQPMVDVRGLHKAYGPTAVLRGIDLRVDAGEIVALLGPNGAGKTTLISILSTLVRPDSGSARIADFDVVQRAHDVRGVISLTGQYAAVDGILSGRENLRMMCRLNGLSGQAARHRADELLARFDLEPAADRRVSTYSGGMRRRLDIAISLVSTPQVLFLDEPTTGLDPRSRSEVWAFVRQLSRDGVTVLLTTQYLEEADQLADRIAVLDGGSIVASGTAAQLKSAVGAARLEVQFDGGDAESIVTDGSFDSLYRQLGDLRQDPRGVAAIELRTPTLDDAFLTLTGQHATHHPHTTNGPHEPAPSAPPPSTESAPSTTTTGNPS